MSQLDLELGQTAYATIDEMRRQRGRWGLEQSGELARKCWQHVLEILKHGEILFHTSDGILANDRTLECIKHGAGPCWDPHELIRHLIRNSDPQHYEQFTDEHLCQQGVAVHSRQSRWLMRVLIAWKGKIQ
jgi:hypothetical protein